MLASQRQERILAQVRAHGAVRVADLVVALDVSDMTVRRDIAELARAGLVRRVHGGAVAPDTPARSTDEPGFEAKRTWAGAEKAAVARAALADVEPGQAIALSAGSTTWLLAELVAADPALRPLTVVTNGLRVADVLHAAGDDALEVVLTGGTRTPSDALVGPVADATLARLRVDRTFLGVHGLDADGATTPNLAEAATDRALLRCAAATTVVADHTKWGTVGLARICGYDEVDTLVVDAGLPPQARAHLAAAVDRLVLAPAGEPAPAPTDPTASPASPTAPPAAPSPAGTDHRSTP
ncbi:DeoR/GlpR family DNA-binding transcription regulator [Cellulomonas shaoxiangyii]|uniref:DeoR/GlpR transcriptional regulator n=1 Tax=Cellulomonas shaoxiangyii TaxID=2566013 RepID=A0A4P7SHN0_9CELL|nr:DeoR/GlpR family DNA-binding transcription regulator [Cellulomonas shaoxiangyii]QCB93027.1 DeoR/GlpR transcriptional regulator [Cellulomonas shaoxiangyii]TGY85557.1 DeoR/GlpR transcriptional regulator [Cellulomonas shaoxiangyii]